MTSHTGEVIGRLKVNVPFSFGLLHLAPLWPDFMARHPRVVAHHQTNRGHGPTILAAYRALAGADWLFQTDAPGAHAFGARGSRTLALGTGMGRLTEAQLDAAVRGRLPPR